MEGRTLRVDGDDLADTIPNMPPITDETQRPAVSREAPQEQAPVRSEELWWARVGNLADISGRDWKRARKHFAQISLKSD